MQPTDLAKYLTAFLTQYLPAQRNASPHTITAYRDTFKLLLRFCRDHRGIPPHQLHLAQLDVPCLLAFLESAATERQWTTRTRNQRLAALHAFFRYLQTEAPDYLLQCQQILALPSHKYAPPVVGYLAPEAVAAILQQPDLTTCTGRRDAVLLSLLYDTGARVQELIELSPRAVRLESPAHVQLTGKGRKRRMVPLMASTVALLQAYMQEQELLRPEHLDVPLFGNRMGGRFSRSGIRYLLAKYTTRAGVTLSDTQQHISPHIFRHTKAMHLLQAGTPLVIIRDILGHADVRSTEIYARADLEMQRRALAQAHHQGVTPPIPSWQTNHDLLEWLSSL